MIWRILCGFHVQFDYYFTDFTDSVEPFPTEGAIYGQAVTGTRNFSIENNTFQSMVFPNPITPNDILTVDFDGNIKGKKQVRILDANGCVLYMMKGIDDAQLKIPMEGD